MKDDMKEQDGMHASQNQTPDDLDRLLDAELTKYSAVEPRKGLEERILANLQAERRRPVSHGWWRWGVAAAVAVLLVALSVAWRWGKASRPPVVRQVPIAPYITREPEKQMASSKSVAPRRPAHRRSQPAASTQPVVAAVAKLDEFPSRQPLSEQEKLLAEYVATNPQRAALLGEARMEWLRQDAAERNAIAAEGQNSQQ